MMKVNDFKNMSMGFYEYKEPVMLWGFRVGFAVFVNEQLLADESNRLYDLFLDEQNKRVRNGEMTEEQCEELIDAYDENDGLPERTVAAAEKLLQLAESSRDEVIRSMIDGHMHELAEEWEYEATEDEDVKVTAEQFAESLFPIDITAEFKESLDGGGSVYLEFGCDPDWFGGHRIHVRLGADGRAVCEGI